MREVPDLLTVEEAAGLIRVGRTKAYAMAQEWRSTGGQSGLPVVDFGHVLRVPRQALEDLIGAALTSWPRPKTPENAVAEDAPTPTADTPVARPAARRTRRGRAARPANQISLFSPDAANS